jgi:integrase/recombinase XerD
MEVVMLSAFFDSSARIRALRDGAAAFGPQIEGFAEYLCRCGYGQIQARRHLRSAEHFAHWAARTGASADRPDAISQFKRHLLRCRCGPYSKQVVGVLAGARLFVAHLQGVAQPVVRRADPMAPDAPLFTSFCKWMREQRGTTDPTLANYRRPLRALIQRCGEDPSKLDARRLREFVLEYSRGAGRTAAKQCTSALRMFLRFLAAEGQCSAGLLGAIPTVAHWCLSTVPRCFPQEDVERLIASCDVTQPVGKRDRAILLLLARLGLRASDVVQLRLQDIDWKGAWIHVCGKGRQQVRLPLSQEVGHAIVAYLQEGRPHSRSDAVFLRTRAPCRALGSHCAVSMLVGQAIRRAGIRRPARGAAHLLRHSVASSMLRQGASLQDISTLLRHRSVATTQIYAKVDVTALSQIAQPWVEVRSC